VETDRWAERETLGEEDSKLQRWQLLPRKRGRLTSAALFTPFVYQVKRSICIALKTMIVVEGCSTMHLYTKGSN
jgi:hypothetical protein